MAPRSAQEAPRRPQETPRGPQEAPGGPKTSPGRAQDGPKTAPSRLQVAPKSLPSRIQKSSYITRAPKSRPRGPKSPQEAPKSLWQGTLQIKLEMTNCNYVMTCRIPNHVSNPFSTTRSTAGCRVLGYRLVGWISLDNLCKILGL